MGEDAGSQRGDCRLGDPGSEEGIDESQTSIRRDGTHVDHRGEKESCCPVRNEVVVDNVAHDEGGHQLGERRCHDADRHEREGRPPGGHQVPDLAPKRRRGDLGAPARCDRLAHLRSRSTAVEEASGDSSRARARKILA